MRGNLTLLLLLSCMAIIANCKHRRSGNELRDAVERDFSDQLQFSSSELTFAEAIRFCGTNRFVTNEELQMVHGQGAVGSFWVSDGLQMEANPKWFQVKSYDLKLGEEQIHHLTFKGTKKHLCACFKGRKDGLQKTQGAILNQLLGTEVKPGL